MNNKSQMEIMGMMMVVILIVIGIVLFLVLSLNSNSSNQDTRQVYLQKEIAHNILTSIVRTNLPSCGNDVNVGDLIKECYKYNCDGEEGCLFINETLEYMLNKTIKELSNYNYELFVYDSEVYNYREDENIYIHKNSCINAENKEVGIVQIPFNYGEIIIMRLEVC